MAELPEVFKADEKEDAGFKALPAGWYLAELVKSEIKETNAGDGKYLKLQFKIIDGEYAKRMVFTNLNMWNKNADTVRIAESDMKALTESCGLNDVSDTDELHGIPVCIKLVVKPETNQYPEGNEIKGYKPESEYEGGDDEPDFDDAA